VPPAPLGPALPKRALVVSRGRAAMARNVKKASREAI
jgi:hypothetical protein